jgi:hypothetical protein
MPKRRQSAGASTTIAYRSTRPPGGGLRLTPMANREPRIIARRFGAHAETEIKTAAWGKIVTIADPFGRGLCLIEFLGRGYDAIAGPAASG